jgi:RNA polymerase sigma-70 factor (ECF subfamily)
MALLPGAGAPRTGWLAETGASPLRSQNDQTPAVTGDYVADAAAGDVRAFEHLYRTHLPRVHSLVRRMTGGRDTDELTQDVFVRVWQKLGTFRGDSAFGTWLHRLAVNVALMAHRGEARRLRRVEATESIEDAPVPAREAWGTDIDLERAIAALPAGARTVFVLHDVEGYQHEEIAALTGTAVGTSRAQLFRARRLLREMLER